jgi:hypothetical protein
MTEQQKAAFASELEQWITNNPGYTKSALEQWINQKLAELRRHLAATLFVEFVWQSLHDSGSLSARCACVSSEFATQSVPTEND